MLVHQGYCYYKDKALRSGRTRYRCERFQKGCPGACHVGLEGDEWMAQLSAPHTHWPQPQKVDVRRTRNDLKAAATADPGDVAPRRAIAEASASLGPDALAALPSSKSLRAQMGRAAGEADGHYGGGFQDIVFGECFQSAPSSTGPEPWLLYDSGTADTERLVAFATQQMLRELGQADLWLADGRHIQGVPGAVGPGVHHPRSVLGLCHRLLLRTVAQQK